ncbi:MAG: glycosyltransferase family 4 protein [Nitrososphaerales archaeon]
MIFISLKICVNTQTPLLKFNLNSNLEKTLKALPKPLDLTLLKENRDYNFSPGGVTRMVFPLLKELTYKGLLKDTHWVSLNPFGPTKVIVDGITLNHISLPSEKLKGYGITKEFIWKTFHGLTQDLGPITQIFWQDEFSDFTFYNRLSAERILKLDRKHDFDLFYIHDFQQLAVGHMLHTLKPKIFRWHIPFDESSVPEEWRDFLSLYFNSYDAIIVSCKKYIKTLHHLGYNGKAYYAYPYIDSSPYVKPTKQELNNFCEKLKIDKEDKVILVVARLDPMKGQDRVIRALREVIKDFPEVKLLLIGNGSFSSSKQGIGLSKAERWLNHLKNLAKELEIEDKVIFTGYVSQRELNAAYYRCDLTILPSIKEGFGLVVIEGWLFKKPAIVSVKAGIAELINEGENGLLFNPEDEEALAYKISYLLNNPKKARILGNKGYDTSKKCLIDEGVKVESDILLGFL